MADRAVATLALDPDSIQLAFARNNRGDALNALGRYAEAETLYVRAKNIQEKVLGASHPVVGRTLGNLAIVTPRFFERR